jgi:hypothetical protein
VIELSIAHEISEVGEEEVTELFDSKRDKNVNLIVQDLKRSQFS